MRVNFAAGIIVGLLFASFLVFASSGFSGPSAFAPVRATGGLVQYTASQTVTASSTTTSSSTVAGAGANLAPTVNKNLTSVSSSSTNASSNATAQFTVGGATSVPSRPSSSLAAIAGQPVQSLLLLLPVALAMVLGLVLYRTTVARD